MNGLILFSALAFAIPSMEYALMCQSPTSFGLVTAQRSEADGFFLTQGKFKIGSEFIDGQPKESKNRIRVKDTRNIWTVVLIASNKIWDAREVSFPIHFFKNGKLVKKEKAQCRIESSQEKEVGLSWFEEISGRSKTKRKNCEEECRELEKNRALKKGETVDSCVKKLCL